MFSDGPKMTKFEKADIALLSSNISLLCIFPLLLSKSKNFLKQCSFWGRRDRPRSSRPDDLPKNNPARALSRRGRFIIEASGRG